MIAWLEGILIEREIGELVIATPSGVGYAVSVSMQTLALLPEPGAKLELHIHTQVREDAIRLFGFYSPEEREAFEALLTISGVGPKMALGVLSGMPLSELAAAITAGDIRRISAAPGIGRKTAQRIALELRERFLPFMGETPTITEPSSGEVQFTELQSALAHLGYRTGDIERIVRKVRNELDEGEAIPPIEELVRLALRVARP